MNDEAKLAEQKKLFHEPQQCSFDTISPFTGGGDATLQQHAQQGLDLVRQGRLGCIIRPEAKGHA